MQVDLVSGAASDQFGQLFAEELGLVLEVDATNEQQVLQAYTDAGLPAHVIGTVIADPKISISVNNAQQISGGVTSVECLCVPSSMQAVIYNSCGILVIAQPVISACCQCACCFER